VAVFSHYWSFSTQRHKVRNDSIPIARDNQCVAGVAALRETKMPSSVLFFTLN
jgi:hypothetical protein